VVGSGDRLLAFLAYTLGAGEWSALLPGRKSPLYVKQIEQMLRMMMNEIPFIDSH
jgi:hypothetical protein